MSLDREYESSRVGPTKTFTFNTTTAIKIRLCTKGKHAFRLRVTKAARVAQGGSNVTLTMTGENKGMHLDTSYLWRADVENPSTDGFLAIQGVSAAGDVEITALTYVTTDDPMSNVT